jgi:NAD(P)-dependent dehydrogenase (short-subunit alcohol dehydrogenase family)
MRKVIIITGIGKGFGKELLKYFVKDYYIIGITRSKDDIGILESEMSYAHENYELIPADLSNYELLEEKLNVCLRIKAASVYALINNAGVRCREPFLSLSIADIKKVVEVNLFAAIFLSKMVIPYFINNGGGRIINVSSILSTNALPDLSAYTISKAGLDGLTRSIAAEFAPQGITCNSILPGFCKTSYFDKFKVNHNLYDMTLSRIPAKRWGADDELIGVCELLLSARGGYINGTSIPIDGGWTAS